MKFLLVLMVVAMSISSWAKHSDEEKIIDVAEKLYDSTGKEDWDGVWNSYSPNWRSKCNFDAMVSWLSNNKQQIGYHRIHIRDVSVHIAEDGKFGVAQLEKQFLGSSFKVFKSSNYGLKMVKVGSRWFAQESCY